MLQKILLNNFRNFDEKLFQFSPDTTVIVGPNASGKTNILESIYMLATAKSFKATVQAEMIKNGEEIARVKGKIIEHETLQDQEKVLEITLTHGQMERNGLIEKTPKKRLKVNGVAKRMLDFTDHLNAVLFRPQDMDLVTASPSMRRGFLDEVLSQADFEYKRSLRSYEKGLRQRNRLLLQIRDEGISRNNLAFWDRLLIKNGEYITRSRGEFVSYLNRSDQFNDSLYEVEYDLSGISEARLKQYEREEVYAGATLVGPHRDDLIFKVKEVNSPNAIDLSKYGSRGQQRMGVLWAKIGQLLYISQETGEKPLLLLDDIFSELDHEHRNIVFEAISKQQTIITAADPHFIENIKKVEKIQL